MHLRAAGESSMAFGFDVPEDLLDPAIRSAGYFG